MMTTVRSVAVPCQVEFHEEGGREQRRYANPILINGVPLLVANAGRRGGHALWEFEERAIRRLAKKVDAPELRTMLGTRDAYLQSPLEQIWIRGGQKWAGARRVVDEVMDQWEQERFGGLT